MPRHNHQHLPQVFGCSGLLISVTLLILSLLLQTTMSDVSDFPCYSEDISLWEPVTKPTWGLHYFCPAVTDFQV